MNYKIPPLENIIDKANKVIASVLLAEGELNQEQNIVADKYVKIAAETVEKEYGLVSKLIFHEKMIANISIIRLELLKRKLDNSLELVSTYKNYCDKLEDYIEVIK